MNKIPAINEIDANSPSQESTEVVVKATTVTPDINEIQETISASATIQEIDGTRKPTISEIYKIVNDGLFESTTNWWDYAYKLSQAQINQDIISRLDNGVIGGGYSKGVDIITTTSNKVPSNTNVYSALKSDALYPKKLNDEVINGIYDFLNGITIGKPTAYTGGTWSVDQIGRTHLTTDYLYVRLKAIFETLQILNVDTIGGKLVISPAGSIRIAYVDRIKIDAPVFKHDEKTDVWSISQVEDAEGNLVNETLNQEVYRCYFLGKQDGEEIENKWKVGDQAQAKTFNVKKGTYHKVENSYLWRLVVNVSSDTVDIDGKKYHYVDLSQIDFDSGSDAPAPGDVLNQLGHRLNDTQRQTALVLNAVDNYAPSITLYAGINYYTLLNKEYVEFGVYNGKAFFNVYGDMYIGDKGENPKTYIKYKNGKINIKANLEIGSSIGDKDLDQYIKENGGVDEETVKNLINNSQVIKDLQKQTDGAIETWFYEGVPTPNNYPSTDKENKGDVLTYNIPGIDWYNEDINNYNAIKDSDKYTEAEKEAIKIKVRERHIGDLYYDQKTGYAYRFTRYDDDIKPYRWNVISDSELTKILETANRAQATADGKMKVFYGNTKPTNYQVGDMWVNATLEGKFNNDIARAVATSEVFNADDWVLASRYSEAIATIQKWTNEYETKFSNLVDEVKRQKDQSIVVWYYSYEPTVDNAPANTWNTDELRSEHIGDIFYDIKNNHSYRWTGTTWIQIKDADFNEAMKAAKAADDKAGAAGDLADSKRRIFYSDATPTKPFDKGDLWIKRVGDKTETWVYNGTDWVKSNDKALNDFKNAINEELAGIKGQLDGKAETWYQNTNPRNEKTGVWESGGTDKSHKGDIWYNTKDGTTNYWNGSAWEQMDIPKDIFDTIDGKSSIFVDSYADAKVGTGVICNGYKERDIWILPEDATVNGVECYKGDILTAVSNNTNFNEINWKKKVRYIGPTELTSAIDIVNKKINTINNTTIPNINKNFNDFVKDGVLDSSEKARLTDLLNQASNEVAAVIDQINNIIKSKYLTNDNANKGKLEEAKTVMNTAWTEYNTFINTLIDANTEITKVNIGEANTKYKNLQEKIKAVKQYLAVCQADILSGIGTDITSYKYLKEAFKGKTEVNGGLVVTNVLQLRQTSDASSPITAGISGLQGKANANGVVDKDTYDITSIAAWFGGPMVDKDIFTDEQLDNKVAGTDYARSLFRHDGSGYLASGAIYWGTDGILHGDPNSFILQGTSITTIFYYARLFHLHYATKDNKDFNNIDYIIPKKTFSGLSVLPLGVIEDSDNLPTGLVIGDSKTGGSFQIGNIILRTKSGDPNILEIVSADSKKTAHLGVQGGVSAYGTYTPSTEGGGLIASVISYARIIEGNYTDADLTSIPNAYAIKALSSRIDNIASELGGLSLSWNNITGKPSTFTPSAHTHKWTEITDRITKVSQLTNDKGYLTAHQSLASYYTKAEIDAKGYTTNKGTVTSVALTLPTGLTCATKTITTSGTFAISLASGYSIPTTAKQTAWDGAVSAKHTHSNKSVLDGITSTKVTCWDSAYDWYALITTDEETADGVINKWNEVVSFLANIAQTDTLSGIVDGINKSISDEVTRAKKAEGVNASGISTNKTSITTLQGYFTSGSAKKALQLTNTHKLWGNSFNGTADINGSIIVPDGKYISIGNIKMEYDATNKALKITNTTTNEVANLYTSGGVSAYGVGTSSSSGGGLIASVISYARIIEGNYTDADLTSIPNAYAIKALSSRIDNIASELGGLSLSWNNITGKPSTFTPSAHTHKWTEITDRITKVSQLTNDKGYLTAHQSLASYYTKAEIDAKGYTTNKGTVTSVALTLPTGLTCATKTITTSGTFAISLASGYSIPTTAKQTAWDGAVSAKHTHSNKSVLDGITSTKVTCWDSAYDWYALITTDEETADGVINKWNEVVSFLANIAQTDTLSGIVDGINKSISDEVTRAKKAEGVNASGISTNKTSITTLQGYFTSGSAKKALQLTNTHKLWGNSFNGTADINGSIIVPDGKYISIGNIKMEYDATNKALKITNTTTNEVANLYTSGGVSAYGVGTSSSSGGGLNGSVKSYSNALKLTSESLSEIASAYSIKALDSRISSLEGGSAMDVSVNGSGNAVTAISKSGTTIIVTKGTTFLTSHQSLASYLTKTDAASLYQPKGNYLTAHQSLDGYVNAITTSGSGNAITSVSKSGKTITFTKGSTFLTSHQSLANYVTINDSRLSDSRYPKFANSTWYLVGDNAYIGDHNFSGYFCVKSANDSTRVGISLWNRAENNYANIWFDNTNINLDKQLVMNNKRIWIQGVGTAGGNNNRLTLVSGMPSGLAYNTSCRGTILYSNGIAFADPYNGNSNNDSGWIRHLETSGNSGTLEIAVGDDNSNEEIHFRWYDTTSSSEHIGNDITVPRATGTLALTSQIPTTLPANGGNSDTVDGYHASGLLTALSNSNNGISITVGGTTKSVSNISVNYADSAGNADTVDGYHATSGRTFDGNINWSPNWKDTWSDGTNSHPWYGFDHRYANTGAYSTTISDYFGMTIKTYNTLRLDYGKLLLNGTSIYDINVASATKLAAARTIWGQGFDGTGNVNGTIYINNSNSSNGAIRLNNDKSVNARISAIDSQVIFNTGAAIRFGETAWDWNKWAGLKYTHSNKTIYLGIADGSAFDANSAQSNGTLRLAGITIITPDSGTRIGGSGGNLYLGNANNTNWVKVQNMCSQGDSNNWKIMQDGYALFKDITIDTATINGSTHINNLLTAKGIMPTTTDVNAFGTNVNNWDGSIAANVTNMFNGIPQDNIQVEYSMDNGATWNTYFDNPENRFNLINDNARRFNYYLGSNNLLGDTDADKLAQIKKNQLRVTVKIPDEIYQELSWISVDVSNGVNIKCQVYFGSSTGDYKEYVSKIIKGWSHKCDICVGPLNVNVGNDNYRYVRLVFSHPSNNTVLRNGVVAKIRALALTKYNYNGDRYTISTTGHIYDYDAYMNTYFPNSILAKGGVTAYASSDIRLKQDLRKLDYLGIIKAMGGTFSFAWKKDNTRSIGWIAQHVLCNPHLKDIVETDEKGYYKINYWSPKLIATAFGAIEQVGDEVSRLKARVVFLESEVLRLSGDKEDCNKKRLDNKNINSLN